MKRLVIKFKNGQDAERFCQLSRQSNLFLWDIDQVESDILLKYMSGAPLDLKNTKRLYYPLDIEESVNRWLAWIVLHDFDITVETVAPKIKEYLRDNPQNNQNN